jgi:hypothetical protein
VKNPYFKDEAFFSKTKEIPLSQEYTESTICDKLDWSDFLWGTNSLLIKQKDGETLKIGPILNFKFRPTKKP